MPPSRNPDPAPRAGARDTPPAGTAAVELPFLTLWYRFMFFGWMFRDANAAANVYERNAVLQHNRHMCRYLPTYLRRWSFVTAFDFGLGMLFERALHASLLSAWFFTWSCVTLTGMVVITVAWALLANARMH